MREISGLRSRSLVRRLKRSESPLAPVAELEEFGQVLEAGDDCLKLQVPRDEVAQVAARILARYPVIDLSIEELDVGTIIERIFRERGSSEG